MFKQARLSYAIKKGDAKGVRSLLEAKAKADNYEIEENRLPPIYFAVEKGHNDCVRILIEYKASVQPYWVWKLWDGNDDTRTLVHLAVAKNNLECLRVLLQNKARVDGGRFDDVTPLHLAADYGHSECMRALLEFKADINSTMTANRATPLHIAAQKGHIECVEILIEKKANMQGLVHKNNYNYMPFAYALKSPFLKSVGDRWRICCLLHERETNDELLSQFKQWEETTYKKSGAWREDAAIIKHALTENNSMILDLIDIVFGYYCSVGAIPREAKSVDKSSSTTTVSVNSVQSNLTQEASSSTTTQTTPVLHDSSFESVDEEPAVQEDEDEAIAELRAYYSI